MTILFGKGLRYKMQSRRRPILSRDHEVAGSRLWPTHFGGLEDTRFDGIPGFRKECLGDPGDLAVIVDDGRNVFDDHDRNIESDGNSRNV